MPRTLKLLLLVSVLAAPLCASPAATPAVRTGAQREGIKTLTLAVAGEKKKDPEAWFRLGIEYNRAGDVEKAREAFKQAVKLRNRFTAARAGLAYTFFVEKKFKEAEEEAYQAVILPPPGSSAYTAHRVLAATRTQRYRELANGALAQAEQALAKNPDAPG